MRHSQLHWKMYKMLCWKILFQNHSNYKIWHVAEEQLVYYGNQLKIQCLAVEKKSLHMWFDQSATTCYEGQHVAKLWKSLTGYGGVDALWVAVLGIHASRRSVIRASVDLQAGRSCALCYTLNLPLWHSLQRLGTMCTLYDAMHKPQFKPMLCTKRRAQPTTLPFWKAFYSWCSQTLQCLNVHHLFTIWAAPSPPTQLRISESLCHRIIAGTAGCNCYIFCSCRYWAIASLVIFSMSVQQN